MDDDGGIQWWAELGQHEVAEFEACLDKVELNKLENGFNAHPVKREFDKGEENGIHS